MAVAPTWPMHMRLFVRLQAARPRIPHLPWGRCALQLLIIVMALGVRSYRLGFPLLSNDESFSWRMTQYGTLEVLRRMPGDAHPPLYYLLLQSWAAVWGTSPAALRSFSVGLGMLCVPLSYAVCLEGARLVPEKMPISAARGGALFSAWLVAVHAVQLGPSRTARMYSLGVLLAGLTAWLLLRALRSQGRSEVWWAVYGVAVAAFCYTHYYAFFTVFAQALFVLGHLLSRAQRAGLRQVLCSAAGFLFAGTLALILYSPWVPVLVSQLQQVREGFWIPAVSAKEARWVFFWWGTGLEYESALEGLWLVFVIALAVWTVWRAKLAGWFFYSKRWCPGS